MTENAIRTLVCAGQQRTNMKKKKRLMARDTGKQSSESGSSLSDLFTHAQSAPYKKEPGFFYECGNLFRNLLHAVVTDNSVHELKAAVEKSSNEKIHVTLYTAVNLEYAHASEIKYHKLCWPTNVTHIKHRELISLTRQASAAGEIVTESGLRAVTGWKCHQYG